MSLHDTFFSPTIVVTVGFSGTYHVHEDAGLISVTVLVLMNSLARDVVVTLSTLDITARGRFVPHRSPLTIYLYLPVCS